jgi:hypothetical protein
MPQNTAITGANPAVAAQAIANAIEANSRQNSMNLVQQISGDMLLGFNNPNDYNSLVSNINALGNNQFSDGFMQWLTNANPQGQQDQAQIAANLGLPNPAAWPVTNNPQPPVQTGGFAQQVFAAPPQGAQSLFLTGSPVAADTGATKTLKEQLDFNDGVLDGQANKYEERDGKFVKVGTVIIDEMSDDEREKQTNIRVNHGIGGEGGKKKDDKNLDYNQINQVRFESAQATLDSLDGKRDGKMNLINPATGQKYTDAEVDSQKRIALAQLQLDFERGGLSEKKFNALKKDVENNANYLKAAVRHDNLDGTEDGVLDVANADFGKMKEFAKDLGLFQQASKPEERDKGGIFGLGGVFGIF